MAIRLGKVNVNDLVENNHKSIGIGINRRSSDNGIFPVNFTTLDEAKDNLTNLIMTKLGERVMHPDFGCGLWNELFQEIIDNDTEIRIENSITDSVAKWLPYLKVEDIFIDINDQLKDTNTINMEIRFSLVSNKNLTDSITITVK
jgi:phage baseplate assembly protein W